MIITAFYVDPLHHVFFISVKYELQRIIKNHRNWIYFQLIIFDSTEMHRCLIQFIDTQQTSLTILSIAILYWTFIFLRVKSFCLTVCFTVQSFFCVLEANFNLWWWHLKQYIELSINQLNEIHIQEVFHCPYSQKGFPINTKLSFFLERYIPFW